MALAGIGVGAPGNIEPETGIVSQVANIEGWDAPFPLGQTLADDLERPVVIGNDANAGVAAEHRFGAGRGFDSLLGVFWGTGVGGGLIVDGRILVGRGSAGEIGHICVEAGRAPLQLRAGRVRRGLRGPRRPRGTGPRSLRRSTTRCCSS